MTLTITNDKIISQLNQSLPIHLEQQDLAKSQAVHFHRYKSLVCFQIIEICLLVLILLEHTFVFPSQTKFIK